MLELVETLVVGALGCNCSVLADQASGAAVVVDPGDDVARISAVLKAHGLDLQAIVHTHAHFDHILGTGDLARETGAEIWLHDGDRPLYDNVQMQTSLFGIQVDPRLPTPDRSYVDGEVVRAGKGDDAPSLTVLHTPGHTPGSVCFHAIEAGLLLSGDTLFRRGIGRTDLWGGSLPEIMASIKERLLTLPGDTRVVPGHGPVTTIGEEARMNPFLAD